MESLEGVDWRKAWIERDKKRRAPDDKSYWDARSQAFKENSGKSRYTNIFIHYLSLEPGLSVLDMGSGTGALAIPLAKAGHPVLSADFSAGMRKAALDNANKEGLTNFEVKALDWNEDWEVAGVTPKSVDVALASRSTIVEDLGDALLKLDRTARKKVAITMTTEFSPRGYKPRGGTLDGSDPYIPDYIYGMNVLFQMGAFPELRYIDTTHGNGGEMEDRLVRWAYMAWEPVTQK